jgi:copper chaperone CopZ
MLKDIFLNGAALAADVGAGRADRAAAFAVSLVHHLPGRLRLRSTALKGNARVGEDVIARLADIAGIRSVRANPETGSLLVEYDPAVIAPDRIAELFAARGFSFAMPAEEPAAETSLLDRLASAIKGWMLDALAEHLVLAIIGVVA